MIFNRVHRKPHDLPRFENATWYGIWTHELDGTSFYLVLVDKDHGVVRYEYYGTSDIRLLKRNRVDVYKGRNRERNLDPHGHIIERNFIRDGVPDVPIYQVLCDRVRDFEWGEHECLT